MTCPSCGEEYDDFNHEVKYNEALDIYVCEKCDRKIENHHLINGKYIVHKCKECGHIRKLEWIPYKKRGRPIGSRNKGTANEEKAQKLLTKWTGEPSTLEEFVHG